MRFKFTLCLFAILFSAKAMALHKNGGGGNGTGGALLEQAVADAGTPLKTIDLTDLLDREQKDAFSRYPFLRDLSHDVVMTWKNWYLDDRPFQSFCRNQVIVQIPQAIWACQNDVEVRINRRWWEQASPHLRSELIFHEVMTALWLTNDDTKSIGPSVAALLDPKASPTDVQLKLVIAGLPIFETKYVYDRALLALQGFRQNSCEAISDAQVAAIATPLLPQDNADAGLLFSQAVFYMAQMKMYGPSFCRETISTGPGGLLESALWQGFKGLYPAFFNKPGN